MIYEESESLFSSLNEALNDLIDVQSTNNNDISEDHKKYLDPNLSKIIYELEEKSLFYQQKHNQIKYFSYNGVIFILSRDYIDSFEWLNQYIYIEPIFINKENRELIQSIRLRYKNVMLFLKYITQLYIDFFRIENNILDHNNEMILSILSKKYDILIPFILHPEFDFDKYFFHRKNHVFTEEDWIHTQKLVELFEIFYFTLLNHMEEYEFNIIEINKEILSKM
jgi:hypothetical protein